MNEYEEVVLTFPDGTLAGPGDLQRWLDMINDNPDVPQDAKDFALDIVLQVRALSN